MGSFIGESILMLLLAQAYLIGGHRSNPLLTNPLR